MEKWRETGRRPLLRIVQPVPGVKYTSAHAGYAENPKKKKTVSPGNYKLHSCPQMQRPQRAQDGLSWASEKHWWSCSSSMCNSSINAPFKLKPTADLNQPRTNQPCRLSSDTPDLSQMQVRHCYSASLQSCVHGGGWGVMPYVNIYA